MLCLSCCLLGAVAAAQTAGTATAGHAIGTQMSGQPSAPANAQRSGPVSQPRDSAPPRADSRQARLAAQSALQRLAARRSPARSPPSSSSPSSPSSPSRGSRRHSSSAPASEADSGPQAHRSEPSEGQDPELDALVADVIARELADLLSRMPDSLGTSESGSDGRPTTLGALSLSATEALGSPADASSLASSEGAGRRVDQALLEALLRNLAGTLVLAVHPLQTERVSADPQLSCTAAK